MLYPTSFWIGDHYHAILLMILMFFQEQRGTTALQQQVPQTESHELTLVVSSYADLDYQKLDPTR